MSSEERFTKPSEFCRFPSYWTSADSDSTEFEVLQMVAGLVRALQPEVVLETGSAFGFGSQAIGEALLQNGHGHLYSLETNIERVRISRDRVENLPVTIIHGASLEWTPPQKIGFAFFDSLLHLRAAEFRHYRDFMDAGTMVAFHDTAPHHGLHELLLPLEEEGLLKMLRLHTPRGITIAQVQ